MNRSFLFLLLLASCAADGLPQDSAEREKAAQILSTSPDGAFQVRRWQAPPGELGEARKTLAVTLPSGRPVYEWNSMLGATAILWSPDSRHVAINDMPGDNGDELLLLALDPSAAGAVSVRERDGKAVASEITKRHGNFLSKVEKAILRASEWREGRLWCTVNGSFTPKREPSVHVPFHYLWVYGVHGTDAPVMEQEWTRTEPGEKAFRDDGKP